MLFSLFFHFKCQKRLWGSQWVLYCRKQVKNGYLSGKGCPPQLTKWLKLFVFNWWPVVARRREMTNRKSSGRGYSNWLQSGKNRTFSWPIFLVWVAISCGWLRLTLTELFHVLSVSLTCCPFRQRLSQGKTRPPPGFTFPLTMCMWKTSCTKICKYSCSRVLYRSSKKKTHDSFFFSKIKATFLKKCNCSFLALIFSPFLFLLFFL